MSTWEFLTHGWLKEEISIVDVMERETVCEVSCNNHTTKQTGADCSDCNLLRKYKTSFVLHFLTDLTVFLLKKKNKKNFSYILLRYKLKRNQPSFSEKVIHIVGNFPEHQESVGKGKHTGKQMR